MVRNRFHSGSIVIKANKSQYRTRLNSKHDKEKWGFIAKDCGRGLVNGKLFRGDIRGKRRF